jgi:hypothetical protein
MIKKSKARSLIVGAIAAAFAVFLAVALFSAKPPLKACEDFLQENLHNCDMSKGNLK